MSTSLLKEWTKWPMMDVNTQYRQISWSRTWCTTCPWNISCKVFLFIAIWAGSKRGAPFSGSWFCHSLQMKFDLSNYTENGKISYFPHSISDVIRLTIKTYSICKLRVSIFCFTEFISSPVSFWDFFIFEIYFPVSYKMLAWLICKNDQQI